MATNRKVRAEQRRILYGVGYRAGLRYIHSRRTKLWVVPNVCRGEWQYYPLDAGFSMGYRTALAAASPEVPE